MSAPHPLPTATSERSAEPTPDTAGAETMKAIVQDEYGTAPEEVLRLAEIARPETAADEILVRVHAASVDRGTWHLMAGLPYPIRLAVFGLRRPKVSNPGRSLAGTVECVGREVTGFEPGDEVLRHLRRLLRPVRPRPGLAGSHPSPRTSPSSRRRPSPSPGSPPCRPCATRREWSPDRRC